MQYGIQYGVLNNHKAVHCHQLEAPELKVDFDTNGVARKKCESTHQVPCGEFSPLSELRLGKLSGVEAIILATLNYRSNWASGKTWRSSLRELAKLIGISVRYLRQKIAELIENGWLSYICVGINTGSRYQLKHHNCKSDDVPTDKYGRPLKFAVPQGKGGPFERMFAGDISWKACLIWLVLKKHSDYKTGVTLSISINTLRQWVGMSPQTVINCLKELKKAGLLKRTSKPHEAGVYELYPKPDGKPKPVYRPKREKIGDQDHSSRSMRVEGEWRFSFNDLWRLSVETGEIQFRKSRTHGVWKPLTLGVAIPKPIKEAFDFVIDFHREINMALAVTDSAQDVTDSAQGVTDSAHPHFPGGSAVNGSQGS